MVKGFFQSLATVVLLLVAIAIGLVVLWQNNNIEQQQLQQAAKARQLQSQGLAGGAATGPKTEAEANARYHAALSDPDNRLSVDTTEWLPEDHTPGKTLLLKFGSDPKGFNFVNENGSDVSEVQAYTHIGLVRRHLADTSKWAPALAYHMKTEDEYKTYTFQLRDDVFWHLPAVDATDESLAWLINGQTCRPGHFMNGRCRVTAHDLVFMIDMLMNPQVAGAAPGRSYYSNLEGYRAIGDFALEVKFSKRTQTQDLIVRGLYPMAEHLYAYDEEGQRYEPEILGSRVADHWYNPSAIGAGPYRFVTFEPGVKIEIERDPRWPLSGNAFDKILFQILTDKNTYPRKLRTGELHLSGLSPSQYRTEVLEGKDNSPFKDGTLKSDEYWSHTYYYIGWNAITPYFNDKRVRQAMTHAFNADVLLNDVMMGLGQRCTGPMPAFLPFYDKSLEPYAFDLERSKQLLEEAGWTDSDGNGIRDKEVDGSRIDFKFNLMIYGSSKEYKTIGDIFKEDLAKVGIKLNIQPMEWSNLLKKVNAREFDAVTLAWVSGPDVDFRQIWHSSQVDKPKSSNYVSFQSEEGDKIIEELEVTFDFNKRVELANKFHQLLYDEQPYTFFYTRKSQYFWQPELQNAQAQLVRPYLSPRPWFLSQGN